MDKNSTIFVAGHRGLVGSAILRRLQTEGYKRLVTRSRAELDFTDQSAVEQFFADERPEYVVLAAAKVGGILANHSYPAEFIQDNLLIQTLVIDAAYRYGVKKFIFLGSSCIYPKHAPQPMKEEYLLSGPLEPTNEPYAVAKIAGIKMCQAYQSQYGFNAISVMPTNLYGPGDNFDLESSHVLPALIRKFHEAKISGAPSVVVWGSGTPRREFLHVDDLAAACLFLMAQPDARLREVAPDGIINVGAGEDIEIRELADVIRREMGSTSAIVFDQTKPDGTPRKLLDVSRMRELGWTARIPLREGIQSTYRWFSNSWSLQWVAA
jgi:GDP-L-fucose synthase